MVVAIGRHGKAGLHVLEHVVVEQEAERGEHVALPEALSMNACVHVAFPPVTLMHQRPATGDASMAGHLLEVAIFQAATVKILITAAVVKRVSSLFILCLFFSF